MSEQQKGFTPIFYDPPLKQPKEKKTYMILKCLEDHTDTRYGATLGQEYKAGQEYRVLKPRTGGVFPVNMNKFHLIREESI